MALPAILVLGLEAASALGVAGAAVFKEELIAYAKKSWSDADMNGWALEQAAQLMGLQLSEDGNLTDESITTFVNQTLLSGAGFELDSVLDAAKMKAGIKREGVKRLAASVGVEIGAVGGGVGAIKQAFAQYAIGQAKAQIEAKAGPVFEAATPLKSIERVIESTKIERSYNTPVDFTPAGISNRLRQAKYRKTHKKVWVSNVRSKL